MYALLISSIDMAKPAKDVLRKHLLDGFYFELVMQGRDSQSLLSLPWHISNRKIWWWQAGGYILP